MNRPVLLLLPGLLCDESAWSRQITALPSARCIVPSFGMLDSIPDMARHVVSTAPPGRFSLAGHSMGGRVALEVLRQAPDRIDRVALLDTGAAPLPAGDAGAIEREQRLELLRVAREEGMRAMGERWASGMVHPSRLGTDVYDEILTMIERQTPDTFEAQIHALLRRPDARSLLPEITCDVLFVCGRQDAWSPLARHEQMKAMVPRSHLVAIDDAGHFAMMEQPEAVSDALARWMQT